MKQYEGRSVALACASAYTSPAPRGEAGGVGVPLGEASASAQREAGVPFQAACASVRQAICETLWLGSGEGRFISLLSKRLQTTLTPHSCS